jgi:hypothetical protein
MEPLYKNSDGIPKPKVYTKKAQKMAVFVKCNIVKAKRN